MKHKPYCPTNITCAVYHADGICPDKKECDCGTNMSTLEERFNKEFPKSITSMKETTEILGFDFVVPLLAFIAQEKELSRQEAYKEIADKLENMLKTYSVVAPEESRAATFTVNQFVSVFWDCPYADCPKVRYHDCKVHGRLTPPTKPDIDKFLADAEKAGEILKEDGKI